MDIRRLPGTNEAVRRFVEELWIPYHEELGRIVDRHELAQDTAVIEEETQHRVDVLREERQQIWIAIASTPDEIASDPNIAEIDSDLIGFISTNIETSPVVFKHPQQLVIGDIYVCSAYRGEGLGREFIEVAHQRALDEECPELALDVDLDNDRAIAFYEELGFNEIRQRMVIDVDDL